MLPAMKITETVLADRSGEGEGEAGEDRRHKRRDRTTLRTVLQRVAPRLADASSISLSSSARTGWSVADD